MTSKSKTKFKYNHLINLLQNITYPILKYAFKEISRQSNEL